MIDGTGMCGGCRVLIDGKSEFACVDGPEFDAHRVDFAVLVQRNATYREAEQRSMEEYQQRKPKSQVEAVRAEAAACAARWKETGGEQPTKTAIEESVLPSKDRMKMPRQHMPEQLPLRGPQNSRK